MANLYVLANSTMYGSPPATLRKGKVISDAVYNVTQLKAAGAKLIPYNTAGAVSQAALLQAAQKRGQLMFQTPEEELAIDNVGPFAFPDTPFGVIRFPIGFANATYTSNTSIPAQDGALVVRATVDITTAFSGGSGATVELGQTGQLSLFAGTGQWTITSTGLKTPVELDITSASSPALANLPVIATIGGSPTAGAGWVILWYTEPLS